MSGYLSMIINPCRTFLCLTAGRRWWHRSGSRTADEHLLPGRELSTPGLKHSQDGTSTRCRDLVLCLVLHIDLRGNCVMAFVYFCVLEGNTAWCVIFWNPKNQGPWESFTTTVSSVLVWSRAALELWDLIAMASNRSSRPTAPFVAMPGSS